MNGQKLAALGFAMRRQMADLGYGARLFVRLLKTFASSLRRFGLIRDQIHFLGNYSLAIIAVSGLFVGFVFGLQLVLEFEGAVKVVLDAAFAAAGHKNELSKTGLDGFFDRVLNQRFVHHAQHFFGAGFGGGQKAGAQTGDGENGFHDFKILVVRLGARVALLSIKGAQRCLLSRICHF